MIALIASFLCAVGIFFRDRGEVALEVLALRQQLAVLKRKRPRPVLSDLDRFFWTTLRSVWSRWTDVLVIVKPEPVVGVIEKVKPILRGWAKYFAIGHSSRFSHMAATG